MGGAALQVTGWSHPDCLVEKGSMDQRYPVSPSGGAGGYYPDLPTVETGWEIGTKLHYTVYTNCLRIETALHAKPV